MNHLPATHKCNIDRIAGKYDDFNLCVDYDGNLILLTKTNESGIYNYSIFHVTEGGVEEIIFPPAKKSFSYAQPLGDYWLLVSPRVNSDRMHNGFIYDKNSNLINSFNMGDGISDVQTSKNGDIWTSYFDEGVFGKSIGKSGLLCFDSEGTPLFDFAKFTQNPTNNTIPFIDDCYAMNVCSNNTIYLYYYLDFPLLALHNKTDFELFNQKQMNEPPIVGSHAFSIWKEHILFAHGYMDKGQIHHYSLQTGAVHSYLPVNEINEVIHYEFAVGRKHRLFLVSKKDVYLVDIRDVVKEGL
ncbi:hypothetical protein [Falsibacillus pallidus]|uniref:Uncharacterized protein n=1 Tax=Falsibacillus pallidus TaxID=493781 RepID=A0A370GB89_9BACI|nr:hypothetical protein [Falsibacillus pallidus]RDI41065.1 hypothetical protein DFR59_11068 [Falsibacillus pallidus]